MVSSIRSIRTTYLYRWSSLYGFCHAFPAVSNQWPFKTSHSTNAVCPGAEHCSRECIKCPVAESSAGQASGEDCVASNRSTISSSYAEIHARTVGRDISNRWFQQHNKPMQVLCTVCFWGSILSKIWTVFGVKGSRNVIFCSRYVPRTGSSGEDKHHPFGNSFAAGTFLP